MKVIVVFGVFFFFSIAAVMAQPANRQVFWRDLQSRYEADSNRVVRVYLDKFGYFYPVNAIPIDKQLFLFPAREHNVNASTISSANLYAYFHANQTAQNALLNYYQVSQTGNFDRDYKKVEEQELRQISRQVHRLVENLQAKNIIFLVHGFNVTDPVSRYVFFEHSVSQKGYDTKIKPLYIEVYWDGLTSVSGTDLLAIWKHAQNNTRWVSLALRDLMRHLDDRLPFTIVTHSLGASVATGALFNTSSKWLADGNTHDVDSIASSIPAPVDVPIKLGMIVPAIPGGLTFVDFNHRSPDITTVANNIVGIAIGYNPKDYATSKAFFSTSFGATTLGCDHENELRNVSLALRGCGYSLAQVQQMIYPVQFTTPNIALGLQDHDFQKYMEDDVDFSLFLAKLFNE
ncbi:hypothetical protein G7092_06805 [Mucilaginibacter sp. HC2]|uniref:hypothetical protein n=1 Tax=Mucilaginibacter inviolabilis TaxID=2714892 RepID=UPI00140A26CA|nr:hypothetical protein [Mucilaginibacter inviolabilis]NHA03494.1 hypothetical protein [Mucilaginibacter inviolabilis]